VLSEGLETRGKVRRKPLAQKGLTEEIGGFDFAFGHRPEGSYVMFSVRSLFISREMIRFSRIHSTVFSGLQLTLFQI